MGSPARQLAAPTRVAWRGPPTVRPRGAYYAHALRPRPLSIAAERRRLVHLRWAAGQLLAFLGVAAVCGVVVATAWAIVT
ncbi:hypothetical protein [Phenylobacterium sp.]|uniref:hypothetical protein n=1 Tax=Phenylobacterium sp. TaxID=1871053 RepID=UPI00301DB73C